VTSATAAASPAGAAAASATAAAADSQRQERAHGWHAARPRLAWAGALLAVAVVLFWCYLRQSRTTAVNADGSGMALQGWEMLHGNLLLSGWWLADVTFYTFEVPVNAVAAAVHGLNADVVHVSAAVVYTLLVLSAALLARGTARGPEGIVRAVLAAGILVAPGYSPGTHILLLSPDHTGIAVPILLTLLFVDRARERWWVPPVMCVLLIWAQLDDPLATFAAAAPIALVCLVRAGLPLIRRPERPQHPRPPVRPEPSGRPQFLRGRRPGWYDAGLAAAAVASVAATQLVVAGIKAAGGYTMASLSNVREHVPFAEWGSQLKATGQNVLILFGADFYDQPAGIRTVLAFAHFAGLALALAGLAIGVTSMFRRADRVTQILTVGTLGTLAAATFGTQMIPIQGAHEIAVVLPFGAVLAGRTLGPWLVSRRLPRRVLAPLLGLALAGYLAALGYSVSMPARAAESQGLADWLVAHHLTSGLGKYWSANSTTLASGGRVRVAPVRGEGNAAYTWVTKPSWYDPAVSRANFVVAVPGEAGTPFAFGEAAVRHAFGEPSREYRYGGYVIMVWNSNLLLQMPKPEPSP